MNKSKKEKSKVKEIYNKKEDINYLSFGDFLGEKVTAIYTEAHNFDARRIVENDIRNRSFRNIMDDLGVKLIYMPNTFHTDNVLNLDEFPEEKVGVYRDITEDAEKQYMLKFLEYEADAIIGSMNGRPISMQVADCNAIYLYDTKNKAYALIHSGWKGTLDLITRKTLLKMEKDFNTNPKDLKVVLGPSISKDSFEVEENVFTEFEKMLEKEKMKKEKYITKLKENNKKNIDLKRIIIDDLLKFGVKEENILNIEEDTLTLKYENGEYKYHSHRRDKEKAGRNMALIYLER